MVRSEAILKSKVFSGLSESHIIKLLMHTHYQVKRYNVDELIIYKDDELKWFLLVLSGSVRGEMTNIEGKVLKIEDINAGSAIALAFLFGQNNNLPVNVVSNSDTEILKIDKEYFLKMMQENKTILENILNLISDRSKFLAEKLNFLSMKTIKGKYAFYIINNLKQGENSVKLKISQEKLAELFGITRPSLARVISEMVTENTIAIDGKTVTIKNPQLLVEYSMQ